MADSIPLISFGISFLILLVLRYTKLSRLALDQPNQRSLHTHPIPRTGGVAIMISVLITWLTIAVHPVWVWVPALLVIVNVLDDFYSLPVLIRFAVQAVACSIFIMAQVTQINLIGSLFMVPVMMWVTNLYNFMDGSDGLAGGMAVFGFGAYALAAYMGGDSQMAVMAASIVGASLAFLFFNFHPARIFMGDSGSVPLGFFAGAIGIYGWQLDLWPFWFPLLTFSPFILDATVTLIKRVIKKERFWQAHKDHYYQRLIRLGWGHRRVALAEYALMMAVAVSGILLINQSSDLISLALASWLIIYVFLMYMIDKKWCVHSTAIQ